MGLETICPASAENPPLFTDIASQKMVAWSDNRDQARRLVHQSQHAEATGQCGGCLGDAFELTVIRMRTCLHGFAEVFGISLAELIRRLRHGNLQTGESAGMVGGQGGFERLQQAVRHQGSDRRRPTVARGCR
jgi:hypothetical protein